MVVTVVVALGATIQGTVGFGLGLFAAPLLLLIEPGLVPGPLLLASAVLTLLLARRNWHGVQVGDLGWALGGRVVGTLLALAVLTTLSARQLDTLFGVLVLTAVVLTGIGPKIRPGPGPLLAAGTASGLMGTMTTIGGPPVALLYQHESGPRIRGTLSAFFVVGVVLSVAGLASVGRFGIPEVVQAGLIVPGVLAGYAASVVTEQWIGGRWLRSAVLVVSAGAGLAVILRRWSG